MRQVLSDCPYSGASLLELQDPCACRLDSAVVAVYCLCDLEAELFVEDTSLFVGGLDMEIDRLDLDDLLDGLGLCLLAVLVLLGLRGGCFFVDNFDLFAGLDVF